MAAKYHNPSEAGSSYGTLKEAKAGKVTKPKAVSKPKAKAKAVKAD